MERNNFNSSDRFTYKWILYVILEVSLIIGYMCNAMWFGLFIWSSICILAFLKKLSYIDFLVKLLILSLPVSYLEITTEVGSHIFKLYNACILFICILLILILRKQVFYSINRIVFLIFFALGIQFVRTLSCENTLIAIVELCQEYITLIPFILFLLYIQLPTKKDILNINEWRIMYYITTISCSVGVILQYFLWKYGINIGYITKFPERITYDLTFTGYSVLSTFLAGGMVLSVQFILRNYNIIINLCIFFLLGLSCCINSSRSGLVSAIIVIFLMLIIEMLRKNSLRVFWFTTVIFTICLSLIIILLKMRINLQVFGFLSFNGRDILLTEAFNIVNTNIVFFLFGTGLNGVSNFTLNSQHNMFLEMLVLNGIIFALIFTFLIIYIIWITRKSDDRYILWHLIISHQFFSSFFATTFLLPILILVFTSNNIKGLSTNNCKKTVDIKI